MLRATGKEGGGGLVCVGKHFSQEILRKEERLDWCDITVPSWSCPKRIFSRFSPILIFSGLFFLFVTH